MQNWQDSLDNLSFAQPAKKGRPVAGVLKRGLGLRNPKDLCSDQLTCHLDEEEKPATAEGDPGATREASRQQEPGGPAP